MMLFRSITDCAIYQIIDDLSEEGAGLLEKVDRFTSVLVSSIPSSVIGGEDNRDENDLVSEDVNLGWKKNIFTGWEWEKTRLEEEIIDISDDVQIPLLKEDDILGEVKTIDTLIFLAVQTEALFPLKDSTFKLESDEEAKMIREELLMAPGEANPPLYQPYDEMASDEAMSRIFFYGIGSPLLMNQSSNNHTKYADLGPFVVDLDLSEVEVRPGFRPYGFRAHFDADQKITAIFDYVTNELVQPGDGDAWEVAKYAMKQTVFTVVTAREHLFWSHILVSNIMTRTKTESLPPTHPIRRLLTVFSFRTNYINNSARESLIPELSLVHRATALTFESLLELFESSYKSCNIFEPFVDQKIGTDLKKMSDAGNFPMHSDGVEYYTVVRDFVREWLEVAGDSAKDSYADEFYKELAAATKGMAYELPPLDTDDARIDALSQLIFVVTAYHELVGTVIDYTELPSHMGFRALNDGSVTTDLQSYLLTLALTASTGLRMPDLMATFPNFFGVDGAPKWEIDVWSNFQTSLQKQSQNVRDANKSRKYDFQYFDPAKMECAVSL